MLKTARKFVFFMLVAILALTQCAFATTKHHTTHHTTHKKTTATHSTKTSHNSSNKKTSKNSKSGQHTQTATSTKTKSTTNKTLAANNKSSTTSQSNTSTHKTNHIGLHATNLQSHHHGRHKSQFIYAQSIQQAFVNLPAESADFANRIETKVANLTNAVNKTIQNMRYSSYKLGGTQFDPSRGIYVVDCSDYVDHMLNQANPRAYFSLVNGTGTSKPTTQDYYSFFNQLPYQSNRSWSKIDDATRLQAGDILVFRNGWGGHVMVVMDKPVRRNDVLMLRVADSASSGHSQDTRPAHTSGIGIGTMLLKVDGATNRPAAYAWRVGAPWENVRFAMGRPLA